MSGNTINDGGPAFPVDHQFVNPRATEEELKIACGITARDWFAGQALTGMLHNQFPAAPKDFAKKSYEIADAMLAARQSK